MITLNPIRAYRRWRLRKKKREDARLRLLSLSLANTPGMMYETLIRTHVYYLYLKYGFDKSGVEIGEIFKRVGEEIPGFNVPERPIRPR